MGIFSNILNQTDLRSYFRIYGVKLYLRLLTKVTILRWEGTIGSTFKDVLLIHLWILLQILFEEVIHAFQDVASPILHLLFLQRVERSRLGWWSEKVVLQDIEGLAAPNLPLTLFLRVGRFLKKIHYWYSITVTRYQLDLIKSIYKVVVINNLKKIIVYENTISFFKANTIAQDHWARNWAIFFLFIQKCLSSKFRVVWISKQRLLFKRWVPLFKRKGHDSCQCHGYARAFNGRSSVPRSFT